jgi:hypothetical protein
VYHIDAKSVPKSLNIIDINKKSSCDPEINIIKKCLQMGNFENAPTSYKVIQSELCVYNDILLWGSRIIIPLVMRNQVLKIAHEGYPGVVSMKQRLFSKFWWPGMDKQVERYVTTCHGCQIVTLSNHPTPMRRRNLPDGP